MPFYTVTLALSAHPLLIVCFPPPSRPLPCIVLGTSEPYFFIYWHLWVWLLWHCRFPMSTMCAGRLPLGGSWVIQLRNKSGPSWKEWFQATFHFLAVCILSLRERPTPLSARDQKNSSIAGFSSPTAGLQPQSCSQKWQYRKGLSSPGFLHPSPHPSASWQCCWGWGEVTESSSAL